MKKIPTNRINHILIRGANWVGDAVMTIPTLRSIRKNFPGAEITMLAKPWVAPVFESCPYVDHIMIYQASGRHRGMPGIMRLGRDIRNRKFDLAVLFQNAFEAAWLAFLGGIPYRLGYRTDGRHLLLTHGVPVTAELKQKHQVEYYLGILEGAGLQTYGSELSLHLTASERRTAVDRLRSSGVKPGDLLIGINPGAAFGTAKRWFPERYAQLGQRLKQLDSGIHVAVFGGPGEKGLGESVSGQIGDRCLNLCGKTSLREAMALIDACRLFITNDSGLMHIAAALNVTQLAIFGSTNYTVTSPFSDESHMIRVPTDCSPCMKPDCPKGHHACMAAVTVDMVFRKARTLLSRSLAADHRGGRP